jgi:MFS family permease
MGSAVERLRRAFARDPRIALLILGGAALGYASGSSQHAITWLVQERGFAFREAAWLSALVIATAGLSGNIAIGAVTDLARQRSARARLLAFVGLGLAGLALAAGFYTAGARSPLFFGCWFGAQAWLLGWYGPLLAAVQERAPADGRATLVGFALMVVNLLGVALGPWITGVIGDGAGLTSGLLASLGVGVVGLLLIALSSTRDAGAAPPARSPADTHSSHS